MNVVKIARCEVHGLHGERERCYVCDRPCEQVEMVPLEHVDALAARNDTLGETLVAVVDALTEAVDALEQEPATPSRVKSLERLVEAIRIARVAFKPLSTADRSTE